MLLVLSSNLFKESLLPDVQSTHPAVVNQTPLAWFRAAHRQTSPQWQCLDNVVAFMVVRITLRVFTVTTAHWQDGVDGRNDTSVIVCGWFHQHILFLCIQNTQIQKLVTTVPTNTAKLLVLFETSSLSVSACNRSFKAAGHRPFLFNFQHEKNTGGFFVCLFS